MPVGSASPGDLEDELTSAVPWMYPWELRDGRRTPTLGTELASIHQTRAATVEPVVPRALERAGPQATVLDMGCNEGWFAHRALEWGAARVVGVDVRQSNVRRAELLRAHFGLETQRLELVCADVFALAPSALGTFDVVLVLGLIYHLENPVGALRIARGLTKPGGVVVVESQLTEHPGPMRLGWGETGVYREVPGSWAAVVEPAPEQVDGGNALASFGGVLSLVPNAPGMLEAMEVAGLARCACSTSLQTETRSTPAGTVGSPPAWHPRAERRRALVIGRLRRA